MFFLEHDLTRTFLVFVSLSPGGQFELSCVAGIDVGTEARFIQARGARMALLRLEIDPTHRLMDVLVLTQLFR